MTHQDHPDYRNYLRFFKLLACFAVMAGFLLAGCASGLLEKGFSGQVGKFAEMIGAGQTAAVSFIYDAETGDVTDLGNGYREKTMAELAEGGVTVKARRDLWVIIEDVESHGGRKTEKDIWDQSDADIVVCGHYRIQRTNDPGKQPSIFLVMKAFRVENSSLVKSFEWVETLAPDWARMHTKCRGNVWNHKMRQVVGGRKNDNSPILKASLDKSPACYLPQEPARVEITTEPECYLYLIDLAADGTASLLFPNSILKDPKVTSSKFVFPPSALGDRMQLVFNPMDEGTTLEAIKVVASRRPLDFSFLPVPENSYYFGASGGDLKRMLRVLENAGDYSEQTLNYAVGRDCE